MAIYSSRQNTIAYFYRNGYFLVYTCMHAIKIKNKKQKKGMFNLNIFDFFDATCVCMGLIEDF